MAGKKYRVGSPEGAAWAAQTLGREVEQDESIELEINEDIERAVIAAGWLEHETKSKAKGGGS